jgi:hypothetical protein
LATFNGFTIIPLPTVPACPKSIEWATQNVVAMSRSPFTGQQQIYNWQSSWLEASLSYQPMTNVQFQPWGGFLMGMQGIANIFQFGDPNMLKPMGSGSGSPLVDGANQTGYSLATRGWTAFAAGVLLPGDWLQIGYRLYRNVGVVNADGSGHATLTIWPNIRESPLDGTVITLNNTQGVFRLKKNTPGWSVKPGPIYSVTFEITDAF